MPLRFWLDDGLLALLLLVWLTAAAYAFRHNVRRRWLPGLFFVLAYVLCVVGAGSHDSMSRLSARSLQTLKSPGSPSHLEPDWGKNFSAEERAGYSRMLARTSFQWWGMRMKYFDLDGSMHVYQPTEEDRDQRTARLFLIEQTARDERLYMYAAIAWLFLPLTAIGLSLTPLWAKVETLSAALDRALARSQRS